MLSLKEILNLDILKEAKIRSGQDQLKQRRVKSVSVIEIPVENFVRPHEIVLSTGIGCGHDHELLQAFVKDVLASDPAALALATGPYISDIPDEVLRTAEARHFPIIEIPWKLRFADITQTILEALNDHRQKELEQSEKVQQQLLNLILHGGNLAGIAQLLYEKTKKPALIVDQNGIVRGTSHGADNLIERWNRHTAVHPGSESITHIENARDIRGMLTASVRSAASTQGLVLLEGQENLSSQRTVLLQHAATAAGLWFLRENAVEETQSRLYGDFVWELATEESNESWDLIRSRARSLQIDLDAPYVCLLGKIENETTASDDNSQSPLPQKMMQQINGLKESLNANIVATSRQETLLVFLETSPQSALESAHSFLQQLQERFTRRSLRTRVSWGIGENHAGVRAFHKSFQSARTALDIGSKQNPPGHHTCYADTRIYRALLNLGDHEEMRHMARDVIGSLIRYRRDKDIDLIETFNAYLRYKENVSQTARSLHLHRQSLVYRLQKIESLTECSLDDPDDVFLIDLCIKLWTAAMADPPSVSSRET